ncbi:MAG: carbohydrate ABC transporter permease [Candidatus Hydrogenedentes bacterium]|nr:carbohydrate ABC transporter permease [Candidatus Hydrogenedentota bacterium]
MTRRIAMYGLLCGGALLTTFPFLWMVGTAFMDDRQAASASLWFIPQDWQWGNLRQVFEAAPFGTYFFNSFFVAIVVTVSVALTSLMAGYAFAKLDFPGSRLAFGLVLATMMIPFEVTLIPNFLMIRNLGWYNTYAALIVPWCANAFSIFLLRQAFLSLPADYYDAAKVDGCGHLRFLARVAVPLVKPTLVTVILFTFLGSYNALMWPIIVTSDKELRVVQYGLTVFWGEGGVRVNLLMCASAIVILPSVALYFAAQRYFLESAFSSGIKG